MFNFAFGLTTGFALGVIGSFAAVVVASVIVEDSPETRDMLVKIIKT